MRETRRILFMNNIRVFAVFIRNRLSIKWEARNFKPHLFFRWLTRVLDSSGRAVRREIDGGVCWS